MGVKLAKMEALQRDNLLANSDFRFGVINQKGQSIYGPVSKWTLAHDGWIYFGQLNVKINTKSITLEGTVNNTGTSYCKQSVSNLKNGDYIVYIHVESKSSGGTVVASLSTGEDYILKVGDNFIKTTVSNGTKTVQINVSGKYTTATIDCLKLEEGSVFTGMPPLDNQAQLLKCQEKYIRIRNTNSHLNLSNIIATSVRTAKICINIPSFIFNRLPTIEIQNIFIVQTIDGGWRQVNKVTAVNYLVNWIILDLEIAPSASNLNVNAEQYLLINTNGYINLDFNDY